MGVGVGVDGKQGSERAVGAGKARKAMRWSSENSWRWGGTVGRGSVSLSCPLAGCDKPASGGGGEAQGIKMGTAQLSTCTTPLAGYDEPASQAPPVK